MGNFSKLKSVYDFGPAIIRLGRLTCAYNDIWWKRLLFEGALKKSKQQFPLTNHFCHQGRVSIVDDFEKPQIMPYALVFDCLFVCFYVQCQFFTGSCLPQSLHVATSL